MLTTLESRILDFVRTHLDRHGHGPTLVEIGAAVGVQSKGTVHRYVQSLTGKGYVERQRGWRGIGLATPPVADALPLLGRIAAGRPIEAIADQKNLDINALFTGPKRFVLQVSGDSMIEAGILDGDLVVIEQRDAARDGEIVVALIDNDEVTLKRIKQHRNGQVELIPANHTLTALRYAAERVQIQGVLVGQMRTYD